MLMIIIYLNVNMITIKKKTNLNLLLKKNHISNYHIW